MMHFALRISLRPILAACVVGLLSGCDARELTAPGQSPAERREETLVPVGDQPILTVPNFVFFDPPPTSAPADVYGVPPVEFGTIPDSSWVVVTVSGNVQQRWNSDCDYRPPSWPCQTGSVLTAFASQPWDEGPVKMWAYQQGATTAIKLRGQGGSSLASAIGLRFFAQGGSLLGRVNAQAKYAWDPITGNGPFSYYLGGGYNVTATPVASPLAISASAPLDSVGTRQYTLQPLYDLQFINPLGWSWYWPAGAIFWYFVPGDSVGPKAEWSHYVEIPECQFKQVCSYAPPGPGRMQASAYVETQAATVRSEPVTRPATCPLHIRGGLAGFLFGYEEGGYSWTANWNRSRVLDERHYDHALYVPEKYDGYAQGKGDYINSRNERARWYNPRLSVWCYAIDKVNAWGIEYVEEHYVVVDNLGEIVRISDEQ